MEKFNISSDEKITDIVSGISELFKTVREKTYTSNRHYFDTFDWRLYKKNLYLSRNGSTLSISRLSSDMDLASAKFNLNKKYFFWWDLPDSSFKNELKNLIGIRSLIPMTSLRYKNTFYKLLNKDEKIVARLVMRDIEKIAPHGEGIRLLYLEPVRGYNEESKHVRQKLTDMGLKRNRKDILSISLQDTDLRPGSYTGKLDLKLEPYMTSQNAAVLIFKNLLKTITQNEEGIKKDIDSEFLHDFRVAVRRTRVALSQIKEVFSEEITLKAKKDFASLGKRTNLLRDLDVYLLKKSQYKKLLPPDLQPGLDPVFNNLEKKRSTEQKNLARFLNTGSYKKIIYDWESFLDSTEVEDTKSLNSDIPAIDLAKKFILKKYNRIIKTGNAINDNTPDPEIHSLRIECKKLRYLLEFFSSLFPKEEMNIVISQLKKLQDNLGDFNDLYVQQESLKEFLKKDDKNKSDETLALGGLISILFQKQHRVRHEFSQKFAEFSKKDNMKLYNKLFS